MEKDQKKPVPNIDIQKDGQKTSETTGEDLKYNAQDDSFELDPETENEEYRHPLPYNTSAPAGEDDNSTYDEENVYDDEYDKKTSRLDDQLAQAEADRVLTADEIKTRDEKITNRDEAKAPDQDEEGYPKKDDAGGENNPIV